MGIRLGLEAKLYRNSGSYDTPQWAEMDNVKDVTLNLEAGEADVTTRGNGGWRATVAALKDGSIEFEIVWDTADQNVTAIQQAYMNRTAVEMAVMDGAITAQGSQGLRASFAITKFTRNEPLEEAISVSVTAKPTYSDHPPEWMTVSA
ncbi:MAG: phage tail protein, partial [Thermoguttaceae bacterium]|jgi:hypothetical protein|nr:phage tail protein [Thermoguttaceae bacterium]